MTSELKATLADHAAGNYRILMNLADELLTIATDRELPRLDEKLFPRDLLPASAQETREEGQVVSVQAAALQPADWLPWTYRTTLSRLGSS